MQNLQETSEQIFSEIKEITEDLSNSNSYQDLLTKESKITELFQKFSFLKISSQYLMDKEINDKKILENQLDQLVVSLNEEEEIFVEIVKETIENENYNVESDLLDEEIIFEKEEKSEEEIFLSNGLNEIEEQSEILNQELIIDETEKLEPLKESQFSFAMEKETTESLFELDEEEKMIDISQNKKEENYISEEDHYEKKIKLANIKSLHTTKTLFDDLLNEDQFLEEPKPIEDSKIRKQEITKPIENPKIIKDFKLDLNDRIAFSQYLFNGSQSELNEVVAKLNSFNKIDEAQEFLSDVYYAKDWEKVDNYAQRLWSLVENKFL